MSAYTNGLFSESVFQTVPVLPSLIFATAKLEAELEAVTAVGVV